MSSSNNSKMSLTQLTLLTMLNMMGSGIIMLPTKLAEVGTFSIISWLVTAGGSMCLAYAFAQCGMLSNTRAGMGGYAEYVFGKSGSFMANYTYAVSLLIANVAIAVTSVGYTQALFGVELSSTGTVIATICVLWACTSLNFKGARITGYISNLSAYGVIIPVLFLSIGGWFWFSGDLYVKSWNPNNIPTFKAISASISMTLWAFLGIESACANSETVENPQKNVPRAVMMATIGVAIIYILATNIAAGIVENKELVKSTAPFGLVFASMFNDTVGKIVMAMMAVSCTGSLLSWQFTIARVFKSSSDEGYFPHWFSIITKDDVPLIGMCIITVIQSALAFMTINPSLYQQFNVLVDLAVVTNVMPYILSMAAVFVLQKREHQPLAKQKLTNIAAFLGAIYSMYALYASGLDAMFWGSLATVLGWVFYGFAANSLYERNAKAAA